MRDAVFVRRLRSGELVVALVDHLPVFDREDGIAAPLLLVARAAPGGTPATPLVGEQDLRAVVVERGRVPEGEVRVGHRVDPDGVHRILDVQQEAMSLACAAGETKGWVDRDVVALPR